MGEKNTGNEANKLISEAGIDQDCSERDYTMHVAFRKELKSQSPLASWRWTESMEKEEGWVGEKDPKS